MPDQVGGCETKGSRDCPAALLVVGLSPFAYIRLGREAAGQCGKEIDTVIVIGTINRSPGTTTVLFLS